MHFQLETKRSLRYMWRNVTVRSITYPFLIRLVIALALGIIGPGVLGLALEPTGMSRLAYAQGGADTALLTEGEKHQVIQFNPDAALQKRIFADRFVPNSAEFSTQIGGTSYTAQRAEDLGTGRVRMYYVVNGDWGNVQLVERGSTVGNDLGQALLTEGEKHQVIQFNPAAALQKRIFADGFVPNSAEFNTTTDGSAYAAQRAENLGNGQVRVYYATAGDWGNIRTAVRGGESVGAPAPAAPSAGVRPGDWTATTDFGSVTFTVTPDGTAISKVALRFNNYSCGASRSSGGISFQNSKLWPITNGQFNFDLPQPFTHFIFTGRFNGNSAPATGTWRAEAGTAVCSGTWTAQ